MTAIGACAAGPEDEVTAAPDDVGQSGSPLLQPASETCTETFGPCRVGQCELGPRPRVAFRSGVAAIT